MKNKNFIYIFILMASLFCSFGEASNKQFFQQFNKQTQSVSNKESFPEDVLEWQRNADKALKEEGNNNNKNNNKGKNIAIVRVNGKMIPLFFFSGGQSDTLKVDENGTFSPKPYKENTASNNNMPENSSELSMPNSNQVTPSLQNEAIDKKEEKVQRKRKLSPNKKDQVFPIISSPIDSNKNIGEKESVSNMPNFNQDNFTDNLSPSLYDKHEIVEKNQKESNILTAPSNNNNSTSSIASNDNKINLENTEIEINTENYK